MQLYSTWQDVLRFVLEAVVCVWALCCACRGLWQVTQRYKRGSAATSMFGLTLSLLTNAGVVAAIVFWWIHTKNVHTFSISTTYSDDSDVMWHADRVQFSSITTQGMQNAAKDMSEVRSQLPHMHADPARS